MIVDSGASCNFIGHDEWDTCANLYSYGSSKLFPVAGNFTADVAIGKTSLNNVQFTVIEGKGQFLLGRDRAVKIYVLKVGPQLTKHHINNVETKSFFQEFPEVTQVFGKLRDFKLTIPIDYEVQPVI